MSVGTVRQLAYRDATLPNAAAVEADIRASTARGWFENLSEFTPDVLGVGMPLVLDGERLAVSVAGPNFRLLNKRAELATQVGEAVRRIKGLFEGKAPDGSTPAPKSSTDRMEPK